ncbi:hypothetical protein [Alloalcanivorax xenomutans]|uniref:hypothetical protein n=1 Tax=Alloalcanivorax xenomutans TaxID=1094342 RepID=UPI003BAAF54E
MIPVGYMAKRVALKPDWLKADQVKDLYSVSGCTSKDFADYIDYWKHNGYWLFNSQDEIYALATEHGIDMSGTTMFYYEAYEYQCYEDGPEWEPFGPEKSFHTSVVLPNKKALQGFDIVSFYGGNAPECSYLSCNHMAQELKVNKHCLLSSLDEAKIHLESRVFESCEPGPCRIFAVYSVPNSQ